MYPAAFEVTKARSLDEALTALAELGDEGRVLAGGQSLIPMMKLRVATPTHLVDINEVPGLNEIGENGHLSIGALARHADVVRANVSNHTIAAAAPWVADPVVRNRGTLCGSVAHCDPEGDWNSVMLAVRAEVVARSSAGERVIPIDEFVQDFFTNSLNPGEMVTGVRVPNYSGKGGGDYRKLERKIGDYATVGVATHLDIGADGTITQAGIALTSVNHINTRASAAEQILIGNAPSDELFAAAADAAAAAADPVSDVRGPAEYKRDVVRVFTKRGLATALAKAQG
jgi:carbon-monoxide dehydrogenase medium subunit